MGPKAHVCRVLLVGAEARVALEQALEPACAIVCAGAVDGADFELSREDFDAVVLDASGPADPLAFAVRLELEHPDRAIVLLTADPQLRLAAQAAGLQTEDPAGAAGLCVRLARGAERRQHGLTAARSRALAVQDTGYQELLEAIAALAGRPRVAAVAAAVAERLLSADGGAVGHLDGESLCCIGTSGLLSSLQGTVFARSSGLIEVLVQHALPMVFVLPEAPGREVAWFARDERIASAAVAPIRAGAKVIGMLAVTAVRPDAFTRAELRSLQGLADVAGTGFSLADAEELRATFLRELITGIEDERRRIARDIHDEAGQLLTGVLVNLHALEKGVSSGPGSPLAIAQQLASRALTELQRIARGLGPAVMTELAFEQAVRRLADDHHRNHNVQVDVVFNGLLAGPELPTTVQVALYRIVQEALTNSARHARARTVAILVRRSGGKLNLIIEDDGAGMDPATKSQGSGLRNIAERIALLRGKFTLESSAGLGTALFVEIPLGGADGQNQSPHR